MDKDKLVAINRMPVLREVVSGNITGFCIIESMK